MPRPRGGSRQGAPGASYAQRTDLNQAVRSAPSKSYGEAAASASAQRMIPLPQAPPPPTPGRLAFDRETERPAEPVTTGLTVGAGRGPSAMMPSVDPMLELLRAAYRALPNERIGSLIEALESEG